MTNEEEKVANMSEEMAPNANDEKQLDMNELEQVGGGWTLCCGIGISSDVMAQACLDGGSSTNDDQVTVGATACAFVGVGVGAGDSKIDDSDLDDAPEYMNYP